MSEFMAELIGTMILIYLGDSVVAAVSLRGTKTEGVGGSWLLVALGWGLTLSVAIYAVGQFSGAHLNPAVTLALASVGTFAWSKVGLYILAQMIGAFIGAILVYLQYLPHWRVTEDPAAKLGVFTTGPAIRSPLANLLSETFGTFILVLGILFVGAHQFQDGWNPLIIGLLLATIGITIGSTTGFSINPARDLAPRIAHAILPIPGKGSSDWGYSWIPIVGPIVGGLYGASFYEAVFKNNFITLFWIFTVVVIIIALAAVASVNSKKEHA
ncbi:MIP/aquaporin family protein [Aciduricibacillus chroicocephali]|uniref:MIP/aquaporin family protein n=1 Tax=Aciduricibacillus chroicocephali TaxID=3054939 RepID=A0ABY9KTE1_9BACI|nr:MIP/aquaporin family protein [Bacillaceae bacterium 44XB]